MKRLIIAVGVAGLTAAVLAACVVWWPDNNERMADLAENLRPISSSVDGYLNFSDVPADMDGDALLSKATENNRKYLEPFSNYVVLVRRDGLSSSVLVCDKERKHALMEDSGCTNERFDARLWEQDPQPACDFQLDLQEVCKSSGN